MKDRISGFAVYQPKKIIVIKSNNETLQYQQPQSMFQSFESIVGYYELIRYLAQTQKGDTVSRHEKKLIYLSYPTDYPLSIYLVP